MRTAKTLTSNFLMVFNVFCRYFATFAKGVVTDAEKNTKHFSKTLFRQLNSLDTVKSSCRLLFLVFEQSQKTYQGRYKCRFKGVFAENYWGKFYILLDYQGEILYIIGLPGGNSKYYWTTRGKFYDWQCKHVSRTKCTGRTWFKCCSRCKTGTITFPAVDHLPSKNS